jgi:hypothetical protein
MEPINHSAGSNRLGTARDQIGANSSREPMPIGSAMRRGGTPNDARGAGRHAFALVMPYVNTGAMQDFLDRLAVTLHPDEHVAMMLDQAGWRSDAAPKTSPK